KPPLAHCALAGVPLTVHIFMLAVANGQRAAAVPIALHEPESVHRRIDGGEDNWPVVTFPSTRHFAFSARSAYSAGASRRCEGNRHDLSRPIFATAFERPAHRRRAVA